MKLNISKVQGHTESRSFQNGLDSTYSEFPLREPKYVTEDNRIN